MEFQNFWNIIMENPIHMSTMNAHQHKRDINVTKVGKAHHTTPPH